MKIGSLMMRLSVVLLSLGMLGGIVMGIKENFQLASAHAHLNLVGGVLLFLFGLYYTLVPAAGSDPLARIQGWLHITGAIVFPGGLALLLGIGPAFVPVTIVGSLIVISAIVLFAIIVFRTTRV